MNVKISSSLNAPYVHSALECTRDLEISDGDDGNGEPIVYVGGDWQPLSVLSTADIEWGQGDPHDTIELHSIDHDVYAQAKVLCNAALNSGNNASLDDISTTLSDVITAEKSIRNRLAEATGVEVVFLALPSGLRSTTYCPTRQRYVGLHFDDFGEHGVRDVTRGSLRLSVNMGAADRYFCFAAVSFAEASALFQALPRDARSKRSGLAAAYCRSRRPTIYRLALRPGDYYIAPTQNLIHDGQTNRDALPDLTVSLRIPAGALV